MRGLVALSFAFAACHASGVEVIVQPPADGSAIDGVAMFVGLGSGQMIDVVTASQHRATGVAWQQDAPFLACGGSGAKPCEFPQHFTYEGGGVDQIGALIAVGLADGDAVAAAQALDVRVPANQVDRVELELATLDGEVWTPDPGSNVTTPCVRDGDPSQSSFVVDLDDRDCDGYADRDPLECVPDQYMSSRGPRNLADVTCTLESQDASGARCTLGGESCMDSRGPISGSCAEGAFCVPTSACDLCQSSPTPDARLACLVGLGEQLQLMPAVGHVECNVVAIGDVANGFTVCGGGARLAMTIPGNATFACSDARVSFDGKNWGGSATMGPVTLGATISSAAGTGCSLDITMPQVTMSAIGAVVIGGVLAMETDQPRGLALPIVVIPNVTGGSSCVASEMSCALSTGSGGFADLPACMAIAPPLNTPQQL